MISKQKLDAMKLLKNGINIYCKSLVTAVFKYPDYAIKLHKIEIDGICKKCTEK